MLSTIFSRLITGYFFIFLLLVGAGIYSISRIQALNQTITSIVERDNRLIFLKQKLSESILSQTQTVSKYRIVKDKKLYELILDYDREIKRHIAELERLIQGSGREAIADSIASKYKEYFKLITGQDKKALSEKERERLKEALLEELFRALKTLQDYAEGSAKEKIAKTHVAGQRAVTLTLTVTILSIMIGLFISVITTRSIVRPLSLIKGQMKRIASGSFEGKAEIASPLELKELADTFNYMSEKLKEVDRMKNDFYAVMSHELRTPLASIKEGSKILMEGYMGELSDKQRMILDIISKESLRLIEMINNILDLSKLEAGMVRFDFREMELDSLIKRVIYEITPLTEGKRIGIKTEFSYTDVIMVDPERIMHVMRNLIGNAIKFTPENGTITIGTEKRDRNVIVSVKDTGPGIPEEYIENIFDKFTQVNQSRYKYMKGTGIGLSIVKHIVEAHGGKVWVESKEGHGSTFYFSLPL